MSNHPLRPLRHRNVRLIWGASVFSDIGTWVQLVIVGSLVARESGSALKTGMVAIATFLPQGISSPIGGLLADRYDRRKLFIVSLLGQGLATSGVALSLALGVREPMTLIIIILAGSSLGAAGAPSYSAMIPDLVPRDELLQMVSLGILSWNGGRVVGPILGTALVAFVGPAWSISFNAMTFFCLAFAVFMVRRPFPPDANTDTGTVTERLATGARALRSSPGCWHAWYLIVLLNIAVAPFMGMIPIYARRVFGGGTGLTGLFSTTQGVGALLGTMATTVMVARFGNAKVFRVIVAVTVAIYVLWATAPTTAVAVVAVFGMGYCASAVFVIGMSTLQRDAPAEQRGRVMSIAQASMGIGYGSGILIVGVIGDEFGLRIAFGCAATIFAIGYLYLTRRSLNWRSALDGTPAEPVPSISLASA